jgi:SAM-dependent methyltransferase
MGQDTNASSNTYFDFDATYRDEHPIGMSPVWSIGEPQPELAALIRDGRMHGDVLDVGCGEGAIDLELAALGHNTVGLDLSTTAVNLARAAAARAGLSDKAKFAVADISDFVGYDGRFNTIIDSTLFCSIPPELRSGYQRSIARAAAADASYFVLAANAAAIPDFLGSKGQGLHAVTEDQLRDTVSDYWVVDDIAPAFMYGLLPDLSALPPILAEHLQALEQDAKGRIKTPAWRLTAHLR